ncbi:MAG: DNA polymerase Y family protein, partial [Sphingomonas bacterium]|nr:DNA polymerase Y family protein [Sphingomonas bacterium]
MMKTQRIASIWLPRLPIERWLKASGASDDDRVALVVEVAHGQLVHAATRAAGVRRGTRLTDARALDPGLQAVAADVVGDAELLGRLARWASRWSPLVEVDGEDGLRMDVSGVAHLFGGEARLLRDIEARFAGLGLTGRVALAATSGAAWGLARYASSPSPAKGDGNLADLLAPLPVAALRLPPGPTRTLELLGLKTIGQLAGVPRRSLARRFREADNPLDALDRMLGRKAEPLTAAPCEAPPRATIRLAEPVADPSAARQALDLLVPKLVAILAARRLGVRRLVLCGYRVDGEVAMAAAATALPTREAAHLRRLLIDKTDELDPGFGFDAFLIEASWCEPLGAAQDSLVEEPRGEREVAELVDRLSVKLGADKVRRPIARGSHLPERASGWVDLNSPPAFAGEGDRAKPGKGGMAQRVKNPSTIPSARNGPPPPQKRGRDFRPQRLLDHPEAIGVIYATPEGLPRRFTWRRGVHDIARVEGPERIAPEWWRERATARLRDYYRVEDISGRRFWIYREGIAGDGRGGAPEWYLHGLF